MGFSRVFLGFFSFLVGQMRVLVPQQAILITKGQIGPVMSARHMSPSWGRRKTLLV
jgi:hypothetical protein